MADAVVAAGAPVEAARVDGYVPIRRYAAIGDGRTAALIAGGSVDWLCLPDLDSPSVFARLLDRERGGFFELVPADGHVAQRRYVPDTNVLETTYRTPGGVAKVTDALTLPLSGLAPTRELVRRVDAVSGTVSFRWTCEPRFGYGDAPTRIDCRDGVAFATARADAIALATWDAGDAMCDDGRIEGRFDVDAGGSALIVVAHAHREPVVVPQRAEVERRLDETVRFWSAWARDRTYAGPWRDEVVRSALALKLLVFSPSGAIAGAVTTSLPETLGGGKNYDYRFSWLRDSAFTMNALLSLGCAPEAEAFFWWLMHASQLTHPELRVLYRLDGRDDMTENELPLEGYAESRPVRIGNAAAAQLQLDAYGDLLDAASRYAERELDRDFGRRLAAIADFVCGVWRKEDSGIWEVRDETAHFTEGKMKCAIGLERACSLADRGCIPPAHRARWESAAAEIRDFVEARCWSDDRRSYVRSAGADALDASILLAGQDRYSPRGDPRLAATIDAVRRELGSGPFLYRYTGMREEEGAFVACSFWLVAALARVGRVDEAAAVMDDVLAQRNDVGLFSEQVDPATGAFLGNFPQGLSHLGVVNAAVALVEAAG